MLAVFADAKSQEIFSLREAPEPVAGPSECLVAVDAVSLNPGDPLRPIRHWPGWPGCDLAGQVLRPAQDGTGPAQNDRVVGFLPFGAWAEKVAVPARSLAVIPRNVSIETAACLPVAGLTALHLLKLGGQMLGRKVLVNAGLGRGGIFLLRLGVNERGQDGGRGAQPGQGRFRPPGRSPRGGGQSSEAAGFGPYDLIFDPVAGPTVGEAVKLLAKNGQYVIFNFVGGDSFTVKIQPGMLMTSAACGSFPCIPCWTPARPRKAWPCFWK